VDSTTNLQAIFNGAAKNSNFLISVKAGMENRAENYHWSSTAAYCSNDGT